VTITPAMLRYLNGDESTAAAPNENYGRELLELFTVGKGPIIGPGNYTITPKPMCRPPPACSRAGATRAIRGQLLHRQRHDNTTKVFSSAFGSAAIAPNGATEYQTW
jgi:hypothetical protein